MVGMGGPHTVGGTFSSGSNLGVSSLLSPTSPTYPSVHSPLSSNTSAAVAAAVAGLQTPSVGGNLTSMSSLANGLQTLSPNGLASSSTDPLQSPLHRYAGFIWEGWIVLFSMPSPLHRYAGGFFRRMNCTLLCAQSPWGSIVLLFPSIGMQGFMGRGGMNRTVLCRVLVLFYMPNPP